MNDPTPFFASDLTAPDGYVYRVTMREGNVYADAMLTKDSTARDGRYRLDTHTGRTNTNKGVMGARQQEQAAQLLAQATAALMAAAGRAGWRVEERDWCGGKVACYYPPAPTVAEVPMYEVPGDGAYCPGCGGALSVITHYIDGGPVCPVCFDVYDEWPGYDDDQAVADLVTLEAGAIAVPQVAPARLELPLTHSLRLVPRPFSSLTRRSYRLGLEVPRGYNAFLASWPYYHQKRRQPAVWNAYLVRAHMRRCERARARRAALTVTRLPPMLYGQGKVA